MIVQSMTPTEVYKEIDKDIEELSKWWLGKRKMLTDIAKWTIKLPRSTWYEFESKRKNRYLVLSVILGRKYNDDSLTAVIALQKMERGYAVYTSRFSWQSASGNHVYLPHVFDRYHDPDRGNVNKTGIELIKHFVERNSYGEVSHDDRLSGRSVRYKGRDNLCKCVNDGVLLGEVVDNMFVAHTFITYEKASGLQREVFEGNREKILSNEQLLRQINESRKDKWKAMREEAIMLAMKTLNLTI